jgi:hypothetical protein
MHVSYALAGSTKPQKRYQRNIKETVQDTVNIQQYKADKRSGAREYFLHAN